MTMISPLSPSSASNDIPEPPSAIHSPTSAPAKRLSYADFPEVVQPDTAPEVASPHQSEYAARLDAFSEKYPIAGSLFKEQEQYPEAIEKGDRSSTHELSAIRYDSSSSIRGNGGSPPNRTIFGVNRKHFLIGLAVTLVALVAVAVGVGVGVGVGWANHSESDSESDGSTNDNSPTSTR